MVQLTPQNLGRHLSVLQNEISAAEFVVALTGAGISRASGLPLGGHSVCGMALTEFFHSHMWTFQPVEFYAAYWDMVENWRRATPNNSHVMLAHRGISVITQNIDGLHRDAGTKRLIELHGNLRELRCLQCGGIFAAMRNRYGSLPGCPSCGCLLHPGITLNGEAVRHYSRALDWVGRSQVLLVVGTSLDRDPVRELQRVAARNGTLQVWINDEAEEILPELLDCERERTRPME